MARLAEALIQTVLPSGCALCHRPLPWRGSRAGVCPVCWETVMPYDGECCPLCGEFGLASEAPCLPCRVDPPPWTRAVSYGSYEGSLRALVLLFKHGRRDELASPLGGLLLEAWNRSGAPEVATVTAVPMRWTRRLRRGFNQAELLAHEFARVARVPVSRLLSRTGRGRQTGRSRAARRSLPAREFALRTTAPDTVVLVDDVMTTGATAAAASRALRQGGAGDVFVLTLARTPRSGRIS